MPFVNSISGKGKPPFPQGDGKAWLFFSLFDCSGIKIVRIHEKILSPDLNMEI